MIKQDTKKKISFNLIDALIIILILVGVVALIYMFSGNDAMELLYSKETIKYEITVDGDFKAGDTLYFKDGRKVLGTIEDVSTSGDKTVLLISAEAYKKDNDYFVKGQLIRGDAELDIKYGDTAVVCKVKEIK